jgi:hypothetical protein
MNMPSYSVLITGLPSSGKTTLAKLLEQDLRQRGFAVANKDLDYDIDWRQRPQTGIYLLQTPHGAVAEEKDGIRFDAFDRLLITWADEDTYNMMLSVRGAAWFREGVAEKTEDFLPTPYAIEKLPRIMRKITGFASRRARNHTEDLVCFQRFPKKAHFVQTCIEDDGLSYLGYAPALECIVQDAYG